MQIVRLGTRTRCCCRPSVPACASESAISSVSGLVAMELPVHVGLCSWLSALGGDRSSTSFPHSEPASLLPGRVSGTGLSDHPRVSEPVPACCSSKCFGRSCTVECSVLPGCNGGVRHLYIFRWPPVLSECESSSNVSSRCSLRRWLSKDSDREYNLLQPSVWHSKSFAAPRWERMCRRSYQCLIKMRRLMIGRGQTVHLGLDVDGLKPKPKICSCRTGLKRPVFIMKSLLSS